MSYNKFDDVSNIIRDNNLMVGYDGYGEHGKFWCGNDKEICWVYEDAIDGGFSNYTVHESLTWAVRMCVLKSILPNDYFLKEDKYAIYKVGESKKVVHAVIGPMDFLPVRNDDSDIGLFIYEESVDLYNHIKDLENSGVELPMPIRIIDKSGVCV